MCIEVFIENKHSGFFTTYWDKLSLSSKNIFSCCKSERSEVQKTKFWILYNLNRMDFSYHSDLKKKVLNLFLFSVKKYFLVFFI